MTESETTPGRVPDPHLPGGGGDGPPSRGTVTLAGVVNMRELGGLPTADGRTVRSGVLYRADDISRATEDDLEILAGLGLATVIDLRTSWEVEQRRYGADGAGPAYHHLPFLDELPDPERFQMAPGMLAEQYQEIARDARRNVGAAVRLVAEPDNLPVVVHCAAGKDRTGVLVAIVLELLGVPDELIIEDYARSGAAMDRLRQRMVVLYPEGREVIESADGMFSADPANMERLLAHLRAEYGSVAAYVEGAGVTTERVDALRRALLH